MIIYSRKKRCRKKGKNYSTKWLNNNTILSSQKNEDKVWTKPKYYGDDERKWHKSSNFSFDITIKQMARTPETNIALC